MSTFSPIFCVFLFMGLSLGLVQLVYTITACSVKLPNRWWKSRMRSKSKLFLCCSFGQGYHRSGLYTKIWFLSCRRISNARRRVTMLAVLYPEPCTRFIFKIFEYLYFEPLILFSRFSFRGREVLCSWGKSRHHRNWKLNSSRLNNLFHCCYRVLRFECCEGFHRVPGQEGCAGGMHDKSTWWITYFQTFAFFLYI